MDTPTPRGATRSISALLGALLLAGCASSPGGRGPASAVADAAVTPLSDLNLVRADIPPPLLAAQRAPYALPADRSCAALAEAVGALDAVLGADLDTPVTRDNPSLIERGGNEAERALRNAAEGIVPFRSWVRRLSGAERYSREVSAAIAAGTIRRAYLKGLGSAAGCAAPAAPR
jgi:hypothetical protein